ncbi:MAG: sugar phosphate isomerase/epimerase [Clostridia bacterium]|nr:sugar phosphate isomerase/epimerase [Clostridia bacterium]
MKLPIALQLYSVRDEVKKDFEGTLKKVKEMGYDGVELSGLDGRDPLEVKNALKEAGLLCPSSHAPIAEQEQEGAFARYAQMGVRFVAVPWMDYGADNEKLVQNIETVGHLAARAADAGITLLYHNHDFEFRRVNGKAILDILYERIPARLLQTQLDTCWVKFAGEDPVAYLKKYTGRAPLVHLKDFWSDGEDGTAPYDLIGKTSEARKKTNFEFRPIGHGVQNIPAIVQAAESAGAEWLIVEQDESHSRPTLEAARMSIEYLRTL